MEWGQSSWRAVYEECAQGRQQSMLEVQSKEIGSLSGVMRAMTAFSMAYACTRSVVTSFAQHAYDNQNTNRYKSYQFEHLKHAVRAMLDSVFSKMRGLTMSFF